MHAGFLDWYRAVVERKVEGLSREDATRVVTPTGLNPLGIVSHLAAGELGWFVGTFAGDTADLTEESFSFRVQSEETVESVVASYRAACDRSRPVVDSAASLDSLSALTDDYRGNVSLRWVLVDMIEETARHAGHLDLMREQLDGRTGD